MQQPQQMIPTMPSYPPANITTEQIQKYLDENKKLILAILDNQNLGKLAECAQYQAQLQKNLMYLAAIADAQPQTPTMPAQMAPHPAMQPGGFYMQQHNQAAAAAAAAAAAMAQQSGLFPQKLPLQFNPHQLQEQQQQQQQLLQHHQQALQSQMSIRTGVNTNGMHPPHNEPSKQDVSEALTAGNDGPGGSGVGRGGGDGELSHMKAAEEIK